ncbi:site-specific DNA-methyltransferase [Mucilaginibacter boryungensis]|uniref:site-specific DNA-methyltransferase (adenine-specific) n=1 Tax=Mucilaginibacter boryungensis TaxID=768480 RepID=A0ABR9XLH5_9SPHI|nr:site-specific DNA-methyltransferase [Mucilaginibacter boryungensis]MBE9668090.1 site-specific DNA-methyltransferase [Mucilaginibacter boryungensis]
MDGTSLDITQDLIKKLREIIPGAFAEDKIDIDRFKQLLGHPVDTENERYQLSWAGKAEAYKVLQMPTTATLIPKPDESINWTAADNIFIEGENLEVLKVLQKAYYGKVKVISIDPPYNTGSDSFIYPDKFSENKEEYQKRVGEKDEEGYMMKEGLFRPNKRESGQFHSNWLSMMLPRLFLAKNLLRDDGVIFVHIDDNELANLKLLMDEIFGEDNREAIITWRRRHNQPNDKSKMISKVAEYILVYSKNSEALKEKNTFYGLPLSDKRQDDYTNPDNDPKGPWSSKPWKAGSGQSGSKYKIITPTGKVYDEEWMGAETTFQSLLAEGKIVFPSSGDGYPRKKFYLSERMDEGQCAHNFWNHSEFGSNQEASAELAEIFSGKNVFDNPKPLRLLKAILKIASANDDIVMDFFGGSGSTAQAVIELNKEDKGKRKFILVQLPEKIKAGDEALQYGYSTISEVTKARLEKVIRLHNTKVSNDFNFENSPQIGLRHFKLASSNFKIWRGDLLESEEDIIRQLEIFKKPEKDNPTDLDILWELALKNGVPLTTVIEECKIGEYLFYKITPRNLYICLQGIDQESVKELIKMKPSSIICLDSLFNDNDCNKTNVQLQFIDAGISFQTI